MKERPRVSVLVPTHDRPNYLEQALRSVLENGWDDFEIIVSDDGLEGKAEEVVRQLGDGRIKYYRHNTAQGKADNWSYAGRQAVGEFCFKLDDDDLIFPGFLTAAVRFMEQNPSVGSLYTAYELRRGEKVREVITDRSFFGENGVVDGVRYALSVLRNDAGYPMNQKTAGFFRREIGQKIEWYDHAAEDFIFSAVLGFFGNVGYLPQTYYCWRLHGGNGVTDLVRTYRQSAQSLSRSLKLQERIPQQEIRQHWIAIIRQARIRIACFYMAVAWSDRPWPEVDRLLQVLIPEVALRHKLFFLGIRWLGPIAPRKIIKWVLQAYRRERWMQQSMALFMRCLGEKK
jgi:glycosyltransferase involved in cell wall biosynthesis